MAYYGGDPLGLNWFPMLALYSSLGNKSNTHSQNCQIGTQLQKLDGKDRIVIEGINSKIDQLIQRTNVSVGRDDMKALKDSIVAELGNIASRAGNRSSGPVVCDANSLVFDEDVKSLLSELVRKKAEGYMRDISNVTSNGESLEGVPRYFNESLYSMPLDEIIFRFRMSDDQLTIMTERFEEEAGENSLYADDMQKGTREIDYEQIINLVKGRIGSYLFEVHEPDIKRMFPRVIKAKGPYILNDIEVLRAIHTHIVDITVEVSNIKN